jgi:hypothetical protein
MLRFGVTPIKGMQDQSTFRNCQYWIVGFIHISIQRACRDLPALPRAQCLAPLAFLAMAAGALNSE